MIGAMTKVTTKYPSIETVFTRNADTSRLEFGKLRDPSTATISTWHLTEKVDGTNIRIIITHEGITIAGRTDNANIHTDLAANIRAMLNHQQLVEFFNLNSESAPVTIYGEGYGAGIHKGSAYNPEKSFRAFDIRFGQGQYWHDFIDVVGICDELGIRTVPSLFPIRDIPTTRAELLEIIPQSVVAVEDTGVMGVQAEGIVAKPSITLLNKFGNRVMWKLTFREFT